MTPITNRIYGALVHVSPRVQERSAEAGAICWLGRVKRRGCGEGIYLYIGGWLPMQWWVGASLAKKERTNIRSLRAPDRYITFSSETGREMEWSDGRSEQESARGREGVRLDGRQFESDV